MYLSDHSFYFMSKSVSVPVHTQWTGSSWVLQSTSILFVVMVLMLEALVAYLPTSNITPYPHLSSTHKCCRLWLRTMSSLLTHYKLLFWSMCVFQVSVVHWLHRGRIMVVQPLITSVSDVFSASPCVCVGVMSGICKRCYLVMSTVVTWPCRFCWDNTLWMGGTGARWTTPVIAQWTTLLNTLPSVCLYVHT